MPYSDDANYYHHRQKDPDAFVQSTFRTVSAYHPIYKGKKYRRPGNKLIIGYNKYSRRYEIQSILEKK